VAFALALAACSKPPPPAPPPEPKDEWSAPPPAPKPPPPKCEALEEKCAAKEGTKAKIAGSSLVFTPVKGWKYAMTAEATLALPEEVGSALAILTFDVEPKKEKEARDKALDALAGKLGITLPKKKPNWKDTSHKRTIGKLEANLFQIKEVKREGKAGPLLIVAAALPDGRGLMAVGFVPADDSTSADEAIMTSFDSIRPGDEANKDGAGKDSGGGDASGK
jgi:hypothetical protein